MPKPKDFAGDKWEGRKPGSYKWYEIQDAVDYYAEFEKPKIIYQVFKFHLASYGIMMVIIAIMQYGSFHVMIRFY